MSVTDSPLEQYYSNPHIKAFGRSLRFAMWRDEDYASLIELEEADTPEKLAKALMNFLRRYRSGSPASDEARKKLDNMREAIKQNPKNGQLWDQFRKQLRQFQVGPRPTDTDLEGIAKLATGRKQVEIVRAALVSYGLVKTEATKDVD